MSASQKLLNVVLVLGVAAALVLGFRGSASTFGGAGFYESYPIHFGGGLYAGANKQLAVTSSGNVSISGSSTSTLAVGCVQTNATSSATAVKLLFGTVATTTGNGFVLWQYGTCP